MTEFRYQKKIKTNVTKTTGINAKCKMTIQNLKKLRAESTEQRDKSFFSKLYAFGSMLKVFTF
jgi:hypothetical protein